MGRRNCLQQRCGRSELEQIVVISGQMLHQPVSGAVEKTRTSTGIIPQRPQRCASTNSATTAEMQSGSIQMVILFVKGQQTRPRHDIRPGSTTTVPSEVLGHTGTLVYAAFALGRIYLNFAVASAPVPGSRTYFRERGPQFVRSCRCRFDRRRTWLTG